MTSFPMRECLRPSDLLLACALALSAGLAGAAENGLQRYSPGVGGSDMTAPLVPGMYVQVPLVAYHASKLKGNDGQQATAATPIDGQPQLRTSVGIDADTYAALPRIMYLSTTRVLGANVGFTAMLPIVNRRATFTGTPLYAGSSVPSVAQPAVTAGINQNLATQNGDQTGLGDLEVSPLMHWQISDSQALIVAPTVVLPTGNYDAHRRVNPGYGRYFTFRPSVQYGYIGDGWDVGVRGVLSFNTRNSANGYYSGNMFNMDWQLMKFVSDDVRVGLQGYFVRQLSRDTQDLSKFSAAEQQALAKEIIQGNKASVNAVGPAVGWLKNGGEMLLEGKLLQEFNARNHTEGQALWLTVSKPL